MHELEQRQRPFMDVEITLPPTNVDLDGLHNDTVPTPHKTPKDCPKYSAEAKWFELQAEFEGQSALLLVHAMMIAILRRADPPQEAGDLFCRIWSEQGHVLAPVLPTRWLISSATTFADHGQTADQRALGMGLSILFDLVKLHDSERRVSGQPGNTPFRRKAETRRHALPYDLKPYALKNGDLDKMMLARLWQLAERDTVIQPLAVRMLRMVMTDQRSIFGRLQKFKNRMK